MADIDKQSEVLFENGEIICSLPITAHTSKIRVKRNGEPLATRQKELEGTDLIEWQISYYKPDTDKEFYEIAEMLKTAYKKGIISASELNDLKRHVKSIKETFFEKFHFKIIETKENFYDFAVLLRQSPLIRKILSNGSILEIEIRHKQRAVGFQSMFYLFIPLKNVVTTDGSELLGRPANSKERVLWKPNKTDIIETIKAFSIASKDHLRDIKDILDRIS